MILAVELTRVIVCVITTPSEKIPSE